MPLSDPTWRTCRDCDRQFPAVNGWERQCLLCWKTSKGYDQTKADQACELLQTRLTEVELEKQQLQATLHQTRRALHQANRQGEDPSSGAIGPILIKKLLVLCHPDKHNNSEQANDVTRWLLEQRKRWKQ